MNPPTREHAGSGVVADGSVASSRLACRHFRKVTDVRAQ